MQHEKFKIVAVADWPDAKRQLTGLGSGWAYRGQRDPNWALRTSLERAATTIPLATAERILLRAFQRKAHHYLGANMLPSNDLEWLAMMQHFGAPTALLDWTRSPYIAAYFALEDARDDCAVWAINTDWCRSQAVKCFPDVVKKEYSLSDSSDFGDPRLFSDIVLQNYHAMILPVSPPRLNQRMSVQKGLFICPGDAQMTFMDNLFVYDQDTLQHNLVQFILPKLCRAEALRDLHVMNIDRTSLFEGIDGFAAYLRLSLELIQDDQDALDRNFSGVLDEL